MTTPNQNTTVLTLATIRKDAPKPAEERTFVFRIGPGKEITFGDALRWTGERALRAKPLIDALTGDGAELGVNQAMKYWLSDEDYAELAAADMSAIDRLTLFKQVVSWATAGLSVGE
ncbi:MAG: hypothetical protein E7Z96_02675 [Actinomycetaceae bacterium]|nr:hypothetical protein [Actinomycetaceae bacterium]